MAILAAAYFLFKNYVFSRIWVNKNGVFLSGIGDCICTYSIGIDTLVSHSNSYGHHNGVKTHFLKK